MQLEVPVVEISDLASGRVFSGLDPFDEAAFAAGDDHGGGAWDEELADIDAGKKPELAAIGH